MDTPIVKKGQVWFLKRPGAVCLTKAIITDITKHTVEIKDLHEDFHIGKIPYLIQKERYAFGQLDFIELVEEAH